MGRLAEPEACPLQEFGIEHGGIATIVCQDSLVRRLAAILNPSRERTVFGLRCEQLNLTSTDGEADAGRLKFGTMDERAGASHHSRVVSAGRRRVFYSDREGADAGRALAMR